MERPYDIDVDGMIHGKHSDCDYTSDGDSTRQGVVTGMVEYGEGLCPDCIDAGTRQTLFEEAALQIKHLG